MLPDIFTTIQNLADHYSARLKTQIAVREKEMEADDTSHHLVYRVLGVSSAEGRLIDLYQNKGRFLYNGVGGEYFYGDAAWCHLREQTGVDLLDILNRIANSGSQ